MKINETTGLTFEYLAYEINLLYFNVYLLHNSFYLIALFKLYNLIYSNFSHFNCFLHRTDSQNNKSAR